MPRRRPHTRRPARRLQWLEDRRMLATDLGQITGLVLNDTDGDDVGDVAAVGQQVELFRDDGATPGAIDGTDTSLGTQTTDAAGAYTFNNVTAGDYLVRVNPIAGTQTRNGLDVSSVVTFSAAEAMGSTNLTVDDFATPTTPITASFGSPASGAFDSGTSVGGELDLQVEVTENVGSNEIEAESGFNNGGAVVLQMSSDSGARGRLIATWDGDDNDGATLAQGLPTLDLSNSGDNTGFSLNVSTNEAIGSIKLRVYSSAGAASEAEIELNNIDGGADDGTSDDVDTDGIINGVGNETVTFDFTDFSAIAGGGANFASVTALQLELDFTGVGENGLDAEVEVVGVVGVTSKAATTVVVANQMSLGDTVFVDRNDDGIQSGGDAGKPGVTVQLYEDTDNDGVYTDEALAATDTTDSSGEYLFTGLFPGDYIVVVPAANLTGAGVLSGFRSSDGNDDGMSLAPDPDTDANGTDKGNPQPNGDVAAAPVTLTGGGEPVNDGDTDNDTNRAVDFGFVGYDLAITKVDDDNNAALNPGETIIYTLSVDHISDAGYIGSIATGATVTDTLPAGLTFVPAGGGSVSTAPASNVAGAGGTTVLTYNLPDLAPEDAAQTIQIQATVDGDAGTPLQNTATVTAADDVNAANNLATASSTIEPEIDIQITKVDDDNNLPLNPGDTVIYTLSVENNGPSTATNVVVTDTLRSGLTFTAPGAGSVSTTPTTNTASGDDTVLTYNLGTIQPTDPPVTIQVEATVDDGFAGLARNDASVAATESETNTGNNTASATSTVETPLGTITGQVFLDIDGDNILEAEDTPLQGVTLTLVNALSQPVATATTDAQGRYQFTNVFPGTYTVRQTQPAPFADLDETSGTPGAVTGVDNEISNIRVLTGGNGADAEANNFTEGPPTLGKRSFFASTLGLLN